MTSPKEKFAHCIATIAGYYTQEATASEMREALTSTVACPSCSQAFQLIDGVRMDQGNMSIVCPSCGSLEAEIKAL